MPFYEYHCKKCNENFECFQKISESPLTKKPDCAECDGTSIQRIVSLTSFSLKGSGWYKDGYTSSAKKESKAPAADKVEKKPEGKKKET